MGDKLESCECAVIHIEREELFSIYGTRTIWTAYCGNGPAHGMPSGHYPLYQGGDRQTASDIGVEHMRTTGHQTYIWQTE